MIDSPRARLLALALAAGLIATSAHAADVSILGSYWETDDFDDAIGAGIRLAFFEQVQLELGATYYEEFGQHISFDLDDIGPQTTTLDMEVIPIDFGLRFNLGDGPVYLGLGGVYYLLDAANGSADDEFGYYLRLGVQLAPLFLEGGWREVEGTVENFDFDDVDLDRHTADVDLSGYFFNLGFRF